MNKSFSARPMPHGRRGTSGTPSAGRQRWHAMLIERSAAQPHSPEPGTPEPDHARAACTPATALNAATAPFVPTRLGLPAGPGGSASGRRWCAEHAAQAVDTGKQRRATRRAEQDRRARGSSRPASGRASGGKRQGASRGAQTGANAAAKTPVALETDFPALCGGGYVPPPQPQVEEAGRRWGEGAGACGRGDAHEKMEQVPRLPLRRCIRLHIWRRLAHCASSTTAMMPPAAAICIWLPALTRQGGVAGEERGGRRLCVQPSHPGEERRSGASVCSPACVHQGACPTHPLPISPVPLVPPRRVRCPPQRT